MLKKNKDNFYTLTKFTEFPLVLTISTIKQGDMRRKNGSNLEGFGHSIGLKSFVRAEQVHGNRVKTVSRNDGGQISEGFDALVTKDFDLGLAVITADCVPLFVYDPKTKIVGIAHAGWKGTLNLIAEKLVDEFTKLGSHPADLVAGLGPCIEFCHYEIGKEVANLFRKEGFGKSVLTSVSGKLYLDLKQINTVQLERSGVKRANIDFAIKACTFESEDFYSFRKDKDEGKELSGEFASIIFQKKS